RSIYFDRHHRFKDDRASFARSFTEALARTKFKAQRVGVDVVVTTVEKANLDAFHDVTCANTARKGALESFFGRSDEFLRNVTTSHLVHKFESGVAFDRNHLEAHVGKLTLTTGLLLVNLAVCYRLGDRLAVRNLWVAHVGL